MLHAGNLSGLSREGECCSDLGPFAKHQVEVINEPFVIAEVEEDSVRTFLMNRIHKRRRRSHQREKKDHSDPPETHQYDKKDDIQTLINAALTEKEIHNLLSKLQELDNDYCPRVSLKLGPLMEFPTQEKVCAQDSSKNKKSTLKIPSSNQVCSVTLTNEKQQKPVTLERSESLIPTHNSSQRQRRTIQPEKELTAKRKSSRRRSKRDSGQARSIDLSSYYTDQDDDNSSMLHAYTHGSNERKQSYSFWAGEEPNQNKDSDPSYHNAAIEIAVESAGNSKSAPKRRVVLSSDAKEITDSILVHAAP